jgi:hypothetical protein
MLADASSHTLWTCQLPGDNSICKAFGLRFRVANQNFSS